MEPTVTTESEGWRNLGKLCTFSSHPIYQAQTITVATTLANLASWPCQALVLMNTSCTCIITHRYYYEELRVQERFSEVLQNRAGAWAWVQPDTKSHGFHCLDLVLPPPFFHCQQKDTPPPQAVCRISRSSSCSAKYWASSALPVNRT